MIGNLGAAGTREKAEDGLFVKIRPDGPDNLNIGLELRPPRGAVSVLELPTDRKAPSDQVGLNLDKLRIYDRVLEVLFQSCDTTEVISQTFGSGKG